MRISQKWTSIITSAILASVVVTTGATTVLAEDAGEDLVITEIQEEMPATEDSTTEEAITEESGNEEAGFIPGDFFYFIELIQEKIRLSLTINDYDKSQLLAEFAAERIAEANSLIQQEKYEEAGELLRTALEFQEKAEGTLEVDTDGVTSEEAGTEEVVAEVEEEDSNEEVAQVKVKLANNITALSAVLAKIDNPKAQAAIMKNIEKSFAKLANKIEKRASKVADHQVDDQENEVVEKEATETVEAPVTDEKQELAKADESSKVVTVKESVNKTENINTEKKAEKAELKADRTINKAEVKAKKELEKAEKKAEKNENKGNHGKGNNGHGNGKGNGNN